MVAVAQNGRWFFTRRWLLIAPALLLLWLIGQVDKTHISLIISDREFLKELSLAGRNRDLGGLVGAFFIGYGASIFVWGFLVDRFGPRICAIAGTLVWSAVLFASSCVGDLREYLLIRFLLGVAEGNLWPVGNTMTNRWFPAREHSRVQAFWVTGATLGTALGVPIVTALILARGWRGALVSLSILSLLPIALFCFVSNWPHEDKRISEEERREIESDRKTSFAGGRMDLWELLKSAPFWLVAFCQFVAATTMYTMIGWIPSYLTVFHQLSVAVMGKWITIGYMAATILTLVAGYIADRTMKRALTGAWACLAFAILVLPAAQMLPPVGSAVALSVLISVATATAALNGSLMHTLVRPEAIARSTGVYIGVANIASAAGPPVFGILISFLGGQYWGGFLFLALVNAAGAACYLALNRIAHR